MWVLWSQYATILSMYTSREDLRSIWAGTQRAAPSLRSIRLPLTSQIPSCMPLQPLPAMASPPTNPPNVSPLHTWSTVAPVPLVAALALLLQRARGVKLHLTFDCERMSRERLSTILLAIMLASCDHTSSLRTGPRTPRYGY